MNVDGYGSLPTSPILVLRYLIRVLRLLLRLHTGYQFMLFQYVETGREYRAFVRLNNSMVRPFSNFVTKGAICQYRRLTIKSTINGVLRGHCTFHRRDAIVRRRYERLPLEIGNGMVIAIFRAFFRWVRASRNGVLSTLARNSVKDRETNAQFMRRFRQWLLLSIIWDVMIHY